MLNSFLWEERAQPPREGQEGKQHRRGEEEEGSMLSASRGRGSDWGLDWAQGHCAKFIYVSQIQCNQARQRFCLSPLTLQPRLPEMLC